MQIYFLGWFVANREIVYKVPPVLDCCFCDFFLCLGIVETQPSFRS